MLSHQASLDSAVVRWTRGRMNGLVDEQCSNRAGAPAEVMNAKALSAGALRAAESSGAGTLLETFRDIHHEIHRRAGEGNRCVKLHVCQGQ